MFNVPGFETMLDVMGATTGPRSRIVDLLKKGNVVIVSPGGVREALFSKNYEIIWVRTGRLQRGPLCWKALIFKHEIATFERLFPCKKTSVHLANSQARQFNFRVNEPASLSVQ